MDVAERSISLPGTAGQAGGAAGGSVRSGCGPSGEEAWETETGSDQARASTFRVAETQAASATFNLSDVLNPFLRQQWYVFRRMRAARALVLTSVQVKAKKTRKFAAVKRMLNPKDIRLYVQHTSVPRLGFSARLCAYQEGKPAQTKAKRGGREGEAG